MAGPLGRNIEANTDAMMRAEILSWSRARGVFAGVDLKGGSLRADHDDDEAMYGPGVSHQQILMSGSVATPPEARRLHRELERYAFKPAVKTGE
jgi:SH3 domain-containing YSC84-like protein 1